MRPAGCPEPIVRGAEPYDGTEPVNPGVRREITVRDRVTLIVALARFAGEIRWGPAKRGGQLRGALDTIGARELFGFMAPASFRDCVCRTAETCRLIRRHATVAPTVVLAFE